MWWACAAPAFQGNGRGTVSADKSSQSPALRKLSCKRRGRIPVTTGIEFGPLRPLQPSMLEAAMLVPLLARHARGPNRSTNRRADVRPRLVRVIAALIEHLAHERRVAQDVRYLGSFDDRMLADIGLTRCEIERVIRSRAAARPWP
jgi:uncharacterized protein YjiS (DUF1127 family)